MQPITTIDGAGRTLMPGLIDAHVHMMFNSMSQMAMMVSDIGFVNLVSGKAATAMLMRGYTSVRDLGGPSFGLKKAIDLGMVAGPRIWPSGAMISQSRGHGDFRLPTDLPAAPESFTYSERIGAAEIARWVPGQLKNIDDDKRDVVLLSQRGRLPKANLGEQLIG